MDINVARVLNDLNNIGGIGTNEIGGITRVAFSDAYNVALKCLEREMKKLGLQTRIDKLNNIFGRREGSEDDLPTIMIGSHLDTVENGGIYDGFLGIASAMEIIRCLNEGGIVTRHPITIAAFNSEEGNELGGTFGSRAVTGLVDYEDSKIQESLSKYALSASDIRDSLLNSNKIKCFLELHVEQSKTLDVEKQSIGIVEGIVAIHRYDITIIGEANHAGTTLMQDRKDALMQVAKTISTLDIKAGSINDEIVMTVGKMNVYPGAINVIPGKVQFTLEIRDLDEVNINKAVEMILDELKENPYISYKIENFSKTDTVMLSSQIKNVIREICEEENISYCRLNSRAGHDAKSFALKVPTGMIFVPSKHGKSHCPTEYTEVQDIKNGIEVLLKTILRLDHSTKD